jgi:HEAT repeat protein
MEPLGSAIKPSMTKTSRFVASLGVLLALAPGSFAVGPDRVDDAITALFLAARAGDDQAAEKAAGALVTFREAAASKLALSVGGRTPQELVWALRCLREIGTPDGRNIAFALCSHEKAEVRIEAVFATNMLGGDAALPYLIQAAGDSDATVRRRAYDGITAHGTGSAEELEVGLKGVLDPDFWVLNQAFLILDKQPRPPEGGKDKLMAGLARIVPQLDERNAAATFDLLVRHCGEHCAPIIETAFGAKRVEVAIAALGAAGELRLGSVVRKVCGLASQRDVVVSKAAIECLARINDPDSVEFLVDLLAGAQDPVRVDALALALRTMTGQLFGTDVEKWRRYLAKRSH